MLARRASGPERGCEHRQCLELTVEQMGKRLRAFGGKPQIDLPVDQILHRGGPRRDSGATFALALGLKEKPRARRGEI